mmetsp:Transcript_1127/g.2252  ORF Transcript_1127/g.2252 Transcript_1127/m.2252 type:complete len:323 (+) Transcript_1127:1867-2835(+)
MGFFGKLWRKVKKKIDQRVDKKIPSDDADDANQGFDSPAQEYSLTTACNPDSSHHPSSVFTASFLQMKNQDCLEQILSFLTCEELASTARTSKTLQHTIFEESEEECHVNMIWHGAEVGLVTPRDRPFFCVEKRRFGSNAREHCHLFMIASKAATTWERSTEIEEDRIMVDGVLTNLMNVRGFDAASVAEKKAIGALATLALATGIDDEAEAGGREVIFEESLDEAEAGIEIILNDSFDDDGSEAGDSLVETLEDQVLRVVETCAKLSQLTPPEKEYHHRVFVRVTRVANGEMICQGFCKKKTETYMECRFGILTARTSARP